MQIETDAPRETKISLEEFIAASRAFDPRDRDSIWEMRAPLAALANNQEWVLSSVRECLMSRLTSPWAREQPSYFVLHTTPTFGLRANIWLPERQRDRGTILENAAFSYDYPHDHNFDILSATSFGPGYDTDIYTYDAVPDAVAPGDVIDVRSLGRRRLGPGTVFLYEACRDVHTQLPVEDITITLNFLPLRREDHAKPQLIFEVIDETKLRVLGVPLSPEGREMSAVRMLTKLASIRGPDSSGLETIGEQHGNPRVADYARESLGLPWQDASRVHLALLREIERDNVAFKYHEVANISRAKRAAG
jgi:hypothetical protein